MEAQVINSQSSGNTDLSNLGRNIYLSIMSVTSPEECIQKLVDISLQEGHEMEVVNMVIDCCATERHFDKFYGEVSQKLCNLNDTWQESLEEAFRIYYDRIQLYEPNKLLNIACYFAFLLVRDVIRWDVLRVIRLSEEETNPSSGIFIKILFEEIQKELGLERLSGRLMEKSLREKLHGMFPTTDATHVRFCINFFTSIGLDQVTREMDSILPTLTASENNVHLVSPTEVTQSNQEL